MVLETPYWAPSLCGTPVQKQAIQPPTLNPIEALLNTTLRKLVKDHLKDPLTQP